MFTGIIEEVGKVTSAQSGRLAITASDVLQGLEVGGSIAVNGVCLTVVSFNAESFSIDIMPETLKRTNLVLATVGDEVNLERPLTLGKPLGGHLVQGHVDDTGRIASILGNSGAMMIKIEASPEVMCYIVKKGFIAVDGISLTIVECDANSFQVSVVGFTRQNTTLGSRRLGSLVNLEVDIIAKYVERLSQARRPGITVDYLEEQGFLVS
ncbi:riboflavin synthase [Chloroflexota bacterium]